MATWKPTLEHPCPPRATPASTPTDPTIRTCEVEVSNTGNVKLDFGAHPEQLDEADVGAMDAMGAMDGMDDLDGV